MKKILQEKYTKEFLRLFRLNFTFEIQWKIAFDEPDKIFSFCSLVFSFHLLFFFIQFSNPKTIIIYS